MKENLVFQGIVAAMVPLIAAMTGFVAYKFRTFKSHTERTDEERAVLVNLLMGLAQNHIIYLGMKYIKRGWVSKDEYDDLRRYLYEPYHSLGGNGTVERIMHAVERLPLQGQRELMGMTFQDIAIRETDETGLPRIGDHKPYEGEERREKDGK